MIPYSLSEQTRCPHGTGTSNTSDGIFALSDFNDIRISLETYMREAPLLITDRRIKRDSLGESNPIQ
jgi:hypothetical protein